MFHNDDGFLPWIKYWKRDPQSEVEGNNKIEAPQEQQPDPEEETDNFHAKSLRLTKEKNVAAIGKGMFLYFLPKDTIESP